MFPDLLIKSSECPAPRIRFLGISPTSEQGPDMPRTSDQVPRCAPHLRSSSSECPAPRIKFLGLSPTSDLGLGMPHTSDQVPQYFTHLLSSSRCFPQLWSSSLVGYAPLISLLYVPVSRWALHLWPSSCVFHISDQVTWGAPHWSGSLELPSILHLWSSFP